MGQIVSDIFDRGNGGLGGDWTTTTNYNAPTIASQQVTTTVGSNASNGAWFSGAGWTGGNDQYAELKIAALGSGSEAGPCLRVSSSQEQLYLLAITALGTSASHIVYVKTAAGGYNNLGSRTFTVTASDVVRLEIEGSTVRVKLNGVQQGADLSDSQIASGDPGFYLFEAVASGTSKIDDWAAGDFAGSSSVSPSVSPSPSPSAPVLSIVGRTVLDYSE